MAIFEQKWRSQPQSPTPYSQDAVKNGIVLGFSGNSLYPELVRNEVPFSGIIGTITQSFRPEGKTWKHSTSSYISATDRMAGSEGSILLYGWLPSNTTTGGGNDGPGCIVTSGNNFSLWIPFSDGKTYWDFGGTSEGTTRLSTNTVTYDKVTCLVCTAGPRGMYIYQDGVLRASNTGTPTRSSSSGFRTQCWNNGSVTRYELLELACFNKQIPQEMAREASRYPYQFLYQPIRRSIFVNTVAGGTTISPGNASLVITGQVPTSTGGTIIAQPSNAGLVITGQVPQVKLGINPSNASLLITGQAPQINAGFNPSNASLTLTGQVPQVNLGFNPSNASLVISGQVPTVTVSAGGVVQPGSASLLITGQTPTVAVTANQFANPSNASLVIGGSTPTVTVTSPGQANPSAAVLTLTGSTPTVNVTANQFANPSNASLTLSGQVPTLDRGFSPSNAALVITGSVPTVSVTANQFANPDPAILTLVGQVPVLTGGTQVVFATQQSGGSKKRKKRRRYELPNGLHVWATAEEAAWAAEQILEKPVEVIEQPKRVKVDMPKAEVQLVEFVQPVQKRKIPNVVDSFIAQTQKAALDQIDAEFVVEQWKQRQRRNRVARALLLAA